MSKNTVRMTAREIVVSRLKRLNALENKKPGTVKPTSMLYAFIKAVS